MLKITRKRKMGAMGSKGTWFYEALILGDDEEILLKATGNTRKEAKANIEADQLAILKNYSKRAYYPATDRLLIVSFQYGGWGYEIIGHDGKSRGSVGVGDSFEEVCAAAKSHADGYGS